MLELMLEPMLMPVSLAILGGLVCFMLPERLLRIRGMISVATSVLVLVTLTPLWRGHVRVFTGPGFLQLQADSLAMLGAVAAAGFALLISLYAIPYLRKRQSGRHFFAYLLWTLAAAEGAFLADDLVLLLVFWGFLGLTLYLMVGLAGPNASGAAKKSFIIIGATDSLLVLAVAIIWFLTGTTRISDLGGLNTAVAPLGVAYWCIVAAAFAKAGAFPLHTWLPEVGEQALVPVTAYLPASLDKLLGIYLLARATVSLFAIQAADHILLMLLGAVTVLAAVMMALVQHDLKRLLAYHAVSQVGYMVLGVASGTAVGIAGGLFHMLNNAIYKSCLFLGAGAAESECGHTDLDRLGGLARVMPITYGSFLVAALAISGVPPLNGFASKWMVYQGIIESGGGQPGLWIIWLAAAVLGSALTLASFVKAMHAAFLRKASPAVEAAEPREPSVAMWGPMVVLAALCVILGLGLYRFSLPVLIEPAVGRSVELVGAWAVGPVVVMLAVALLLGGVCYMVSLRPRLRRAGTYVGGEILSQTYVSGVESAATADLEVSGVDFYREIEVVRPLSWLYGLARKGVFDIYEASRHAAFYLVELLRAAHTGVLLTYLSWVVAGLLVVFYVLLR